VESLLDATEYIVRYGIFLTDIGQTSYHRPNDDVMASKVVNDSCKFRFRRRSSILHRPANIYVDRGVVCNIELHPPAP